MSRRHNAGPLYPTVQLDNRNVEETGNHHDSDAVDTTPRNRPHRKKIFKRTTLRGFNQERANRLTRVRETMSLLLGISRDEEIAKVQVATEEEFEDFEHGLLDITLDPMRPYFGSPRPTAWNSGLCDLFLDHFETENDLTLGEEQKLEIEDMFDNRIQTLRRKWREAQNKNEEELKEQKQKSGKLSRANAQRCRTWDDRRQICIDQLEDPTNTAAHPGWTATLKILNTGGPALVSSDESGLEGKQRVYIVKQRKWRSSRITRRMHEVDDHQNTTNGYGGARPGNVPRRRVRLSNDAPISNRAAVPDLPANCYSNSWVSNLDWRMKKGLDMQAEMDLGRI